MTESSEKYLIQKLNEDQFCLWEQLCENSSDCTLFHTLPFLIAADVNFDLYLIYKGDVVKAGVIIPVNKDHNDGENDTLAIHSGIIYADISADSKSLSKTNSERFGILEFCINNLEKKYKKIHFKLSPTVKDIRPFQWFNYHSENMNDKFNIHIRYTSILRIEGILNEKEVEKNLHFRSLSNSRRQEVRYAIKNQTKIISSTDTDSFLKMYREMLMAYDPDYERTLLRLRDVVIGLASKNLLKMYIALNQEDKPVAAAVFGISKKCAYYLYAVTSRQERERYSGSYILWKSFLDLSEQGITKIDLEGVNSPKRGWFKLSFGGELNPYYEVVLNR